jgi:hypothetical protein
VRHTKRIITLSSSYTYNNDNNLFAPEIAPRLRQDCAIKEEENNNKNNADSEEPKSADIKFSFEERKFLNVEEVDMIEWQRLYPNVNIEFEILEMCQWCMNNKTKAKSKKLWRRFIGGWLRRAQESAVIKLKSEENHKGKTDVYL